MRKDIEKIIGILGKIILGKEHEIQLVIACILAKGHLLIEDIPGVGKTTLAQSLARVMGLRFTRIQFTSDMLPADIIGVSVFSRDKNEFVFQPGPLFSQMVLADELNRATPRSQSALLEAMEERQTSVDGRTYDLPQPFFVIATQNQRYHVGTFPLPESQLDRFLMRIHLGYPDPDSERELLTGENRFDMLKKIDPIMDVSQLLALQTEAQGIHAAAPVLDYVQQLLAVSRGNPQQYLGLSPRAGISLLKAAKAWALIRNRSMVLPEDIHAVAGSVLEHRLDPEGSRVKGAEFRSSQELIRSVAVQ